MWDNLPQGQSGVFTALIGDKWTLISSYVPTSSHATQCLALHHTPQLFITIPQTRERQPRRCSTFVKRRVLRFRITTWRQMRSVRPDWKLLSPAHRDNEQCHACKSSLSLGDTEPALSIRASIIKIVVGPISGDVFPWIVNATCRHFYPCHVALKRTMKDTARGEFAVKCGI